jgi:mRNA-degrading endonuclease toxin of MazEF toxin-antitoxin module
VDKPAFGRIVWGNFVDTRGHLAGPHRAVIISSNGDIDDGKPIRAVVISSNLRMAAKEDMVLLPYFASSHGHIHTKLKTKCAAICTWIPAVAKEAITGYGGWVRGKYMIQILTRVNELDADEEDTTA